MGFDDSGGEFRGSIGADYDRNMSPVMFASYAIDLVRRIAAVDSGPVLEAACGTGIATRPLRSALPPAIRLVATDVSELIIDAVAASLAGHGGAAPYRSSMQALVVSPRAVKTA